MQHPRPQTEDEVVLAGQLRLLELRQDHGIPLEQDFIERTLELARRVREAREHAAQRAA